MLYYASEFLSTRDASSSPVTCTFGAAVNWLFMPYMTHRKCSCDVFVVIPPCGARRFQYSTNHFAYYEQLVYAGTSIAVPMLRYHRALNRFYLNELDGTQWEFQGFRPDTIGKGQFYAYVSPTGERTQVTGYTVLGHVRGLVSTYIEGEQTVTARYDFTYEPVGEVDERVVEAVYRRSAAGEAEEIIQRVVFTYDTHESSGGGSSSSSSGGGEEVSVWSALVKATRQYYVDGQWQGDEVTYFRSYTAGGETGFAGGVKYHFEPEAYARLAAAVANPLTATDAEVAPYASAYFEYADEKGRITKRTDAGGASRTVQL